MVSTRTVRGGTRLTFDAVEGVTRTVEAMHATIARRPAAWEREPKDRSTVQGPIAASVYRSILGVNGFLRSGAEQLFRLLPEDHTVGNATEIRSLGIVNGIIGDHLEATDNTLAIPMTLRSEGRALKIGGECLREQVPDAKGKLVLLVHGLCMSEQCWIGEEEDGLTEKLRRDPDTTVLHLRYNSGRHISTNGRELAELLEQLCTAWPVPLKGLSLVGHSMGGLLIRSACFYADTPVSAFRQSLRRVVCLGSPHHGSMVERAGHAFDRAVQRLPYVAPLSVGRHRSAGIKDLYHGDLLDEDWEAHRPLAPKEDRRRPVPLLDGVDYYFAAAMLGDTEDHPLSVLLGDLLVRLDSATGEHEDGDKALPVPVENCRVFPSQDHMELLTDARVHDQLMAWLQAEG